MECTIVEVTAMFFFWGVVTLSALVFCFIVISELGVDRKRTNPPPPSGSVRPNPPASPPHKRYFKHGGPY